MTTYTTTSFDYHPRHALHSNRTYSHTSTTTARSLIVNRPFQSYLKTLPPIHICENLLYDVMITSDVGSATSSSYINSSEHYDNAFLDTYDNPIQCIENYSTKSNNIIKKSLNDIRQYSQENFYDHTKDDNNNNVDCSSNISRNTSPILFYLENKNLAICACIISLILLLLVGLGIFLLNKLIRPVIINTTVNNHYSIMNMSNTTTTTTVSSLSKSFEFLLRKSSTDILTTTTNTLLINNLNSSCPFNRWGITCENICKPCGLGVCHSLTGKCICPAHMYGEFCDLWKVNDKPKRGDMMS